MKVSSPAFEHCKNIPAKYTADGENINPQLKITTIPRKTKTLVLIVDDPDAKRVCGHTWIHWVVFNIPVEKSEIEITENSIPGKPGESTYKKPRYGGPNPPAGSGTHNYHFKVYALDKELDLQEMAPLTEIQKEMQNHIIAESTLTGIYSRD